MLLNWGLAAVAPLLYARAKTWPELIPGVVLHALFFGWPAMEAYVADTVPPESLGRAFALTNSGFALGAVASPLLGAAILASGSLLSLGEFFLAWPIGQESERNPNRAILAALGLGMVGCGIILGPYGFVPGLFLLGADRVVYSLSRSHIGARVRMGRGRLFARGPVCPVPRGVTGLLCSCSSVPVECSEKEEPVELVVPDLGEVEEVVLVRWLKAEGEEVEVGEAVAEVEADKAVFVLEAPAAGILTHRKPEGLRVRPGEAIAAILPR